MINIASEKTVRKRSKLDGNQAVNRQTIKISSSPNHSHTPYVTAVGQASRNVLLRLFSHFPSYAGSSAYCSEQP